MIALKYPLTGGPFGSPVFLSTSEIVPLSPVSPHPISVQMAGSFSGPDSSLRPIRHAGPSGSSRSPRPAVHPSTFGTWSGRLPIRLLPETLPAIGPPSLAEPLPAVRPSGPSRTIFARSPPHSRNPVRPRTHGSQRIRLHRNPICPPSPAIRTLPADPTATPRIHPFPPLRKPQKKRSRNRIGFRDHPIDNGRQSMLCNRIISTTGSGRTLHPNGSAASRSDRPKGSRRGSSTFRRSTRHWSS